MASKDITINRGDTYTKTINLLNSSGVAIDASGWTIYFTVREYPADTSTYTDADALITKTVAGDASGIQTLTLTSTQTNIDPGVYLYDIQIKKSDNTISSSACYNFTVKGDITRTA